MRTKVLVYLIFSLFTLSIANAQTFAKAQKKRTIDSYFFSNSARTSFTPLSITNVGLKQANSEIINIKSKSSETIIFNEDFSKDTLDYGWKVNSGISNIKGFTDPKFNKVLMITSNNPNSFSYLEHDLPNIIRGKKIRLKAVIKTENIIQGSKDYMIGKLCIKFKINGVEYFEAVQDLVGSLDWAEYSAHNDLTDGSILDDTPDNDQFGFIVPENATNVMLYLGLQNCTGSIFFKNVEISAFQ